MFRLLKSGLPNDPVYPADLKELGYFINEEDEVRMITNPRAYFNFFLTKNDRYNALQREAMNTCLRGEILKRLHNLGLDTVRLPLGAEEDEPHIPIVVSSKIAEKKRVIILFYEHTQDLGVFAYRIIGGRGGINAGSAVDFAKYIQSLSGPDSGDSPGIILANLGQLRWWRRGKKAVSHTSWFALPQKGAVSGAYRFDVIKNTVPNNRNTAEHVAYIFNRAVPDLLASDATLEVIAVSVGAVEVVDFLNNPKNWEVMEPRLTALALVATFHQIDDISNPWFAEWLRKRGRAYVISPKPASTLLAPSGGNTITNPVDNTARVSDCYGCPVYSLGEPYYSELMLPKGYKIVLDWFQEVVKSGEGYENPEVVIEKIAQKEEGVVEGSELEESRKVEVKAKGAKFEEAKVKGEEAEKPTLEEPNVGELKLEDAKKQEVTGEEAKAKEPKVEELGAKDTDAPTLKEAKFKSCMNWAEGVSEEEKNNHGLKIEDHEDPEVKEDQVNRAQPKFEDAMLDKLEITDPKVEELEIDNLKIEKPDGDDVEEENINEEDKARHLRNLKIVEKQILRHHLSPEDLDDNYIEGNSFNARELNVEERNDNDITKDELGEEGAKADEVKAEEVRAVELDSGATEAEIEETGAEKDEIVEEEQEEIALIGDLPEHVKARGSITHFGGPGTDAEQ